MTRDKFQIVGDSLTGHGLSFSMAAFKTDFEDVIVDVAEVLYRQGRDSARMLYDDRFDLHCAVKALRALAVIVGPMSTGDRYRRCADIIARLLQDQEGS